MSDELKVKRSYGHAIARAQASGRLTCKLKCWDCLRAVGITPHKAMRNKHPDIAGMVFMENHRGDPKPLKRKAEPKAGKDSTERRHLRNAVRNREAI
jgi:hypothetical protein